MEDCDDEEKAKAPHKLLTNQLKALFRDHFGAPMAGRMKNVAPFYPFSLGEQAVVAHKFLLELCDQLRQPIDLSPAVKRYVAHIDTVIKTDGKLCKHLAEESYITELGARSLVSAIDDVRRSFFTEFVATDEQMEDKMNQGPLAKYVVQLQPAGSGLNEVAVVRDGYTQYYRGPGSEMATPEDANMTDDGDKSLVDGFGRVGVKDEDSYEEV